MTDTSANIKPVAPPVETLQEVVRRHGTPVFAYDLERIESQASRLRSSIPAGVDVFYSLKANASLGICGVLAAEEFGADVASAGELVTARAAGFPSERICVTGPHKNPETLELLRSAPETLVSIDSVDELVQVAARSLPNPILLRLRPDFTSGAVVSAGSDSRFGVPFDELVDCREPAGSGSLNVVGFHIFAGSQVLDARVVIGHLRGAVDLALRAAELVGIAPEIVNLGGGFGIPYRGEPELDLDAIGAELEVLGAHAPSSRLTLELGRYLVAPAGYCLTRVLGRQTGRGRPAVVVDGGTHQRGDLCGLGLRREGTPPLPLVEPAAPAVPTDVFGSLSLPDDVLAEACFLPPLAPGDGLAFQNAGAYGLSASPALFHGNPLPAEVTFRGEEIRVIRERGEIADLLKGQRRP